MGHVGYAHQIACQSHARNAWVMWVMRPHVLLWVMWVMTTRVQINPVSCSPSAWVFAWAIVWAVWGSSRGSCVYGVVGHVGYAHAAHPLYDTYSCIYNHFFQGLDN